MHLTDLAFLRGRWEVRAPFRNISSIHEAEDCQSVRARKTTVPIPLRQVAHFADRSGKTQHRAAQIESKTMRARRSRATHPADRSGGLRPVGSQCCNKSTTCTNAAT